MLMLFASGPRTLSEAARAGAVDLKQLHHHVERLCRLGLLERAGERPRAGRAMKLYRTRAEAFFIPEELLPRPFTEQLAAELRQSLSAEARRASQGLLFGLGPEGQPQARLILDEGAASEALELWRILRLTRSEAEALKGEMRALFERYEANTSGRGGVYLVHGAVARRQSEQGSVDNARRSPA